MILPPCEGGVGLIQPLYKCQALWLKHLHIYIKNPERNQGLTAYWCALRLRRFNEALWSNSSPHSASVKDIPKFYQTALKLITVHYSQLKDVPTETFTKKAYQLILDSHKIIPKIANIRTLPLARMSWETVSAVDLSPNVRELWWQVTHGVVNTLYRLYIFKLVSSATCKICKKRR